MTTRRQFETDTIRKENKLLSPLKSLVETAFYKNNITKVKNMEEAYNYARKSPTAIVLDQEVKNAKELGLPKGANVLVDNGSSVVGRTASVLIVYGKNNKRGKNLVNTLM